MQLAAELLVHAEQFAGLDAVREQLADDGDVHRRRRREEGELALAVEIPVLRGHREGRHQPMMLGILHHQFQQELGGPLHDGIVLLEELPVACESVVLPQMQREPGASQGPHPEPGRIDRSRPSPQVDVVMRHPAVAAVVDSGRLGTGDGDVLDHVEQRLVALGQIADFRRPVVHLGVDVDGVLAAPVRNDRFVPNALEVGGLAAGPAAGGQDIAPELEAQGLQVDVVLAFAHRLDPLVGGLVIHRPVADVQMHPAHQPAKVLFVPAAQSRVVLVRHAGQDPLADHSRVAADVLVVHEAGSGRDDECHGVGLLDVQLVIRWLRTVPLREEPATPPENAFPCLRPSQSASFPASSGLSSIPP